MHDTTIPVRMYRSHDLVTVAALLPGFADDDIHLSVSSAGTLEIAARLCRTPHEACGSLKPSDGKEVLLDEWELPSRRRLVTLPSSVDALHAVVTHGNGVLVIVLPQAEVTVPASYTAATAPHRSGRTTIDPVALASNDSFPASDPPSSTGSIATDDD